jgi:hypothetical protein
MLGGMPETITCCEPDCQSPAEFMVLTVRRDGGDGIMAGPDPYGDDTHACEAHVGVLLAGRALLRSALPSVAAADWAEVADKIHQLQAFAMMPAAQRVPGPVPSDVREGQPHR